MNFKDLFVPLRKKDKIFYPLYVRQVAIVESAAKLLAELLKAETFEQRNELCKKIKSFESEGDVLANEIFEALYKAKKTPFDRVDLQQLASLVESFLDLIHDSAKKLVIYHPNGIDIQWIEIGDSILEDARVLKGIVEEMPSIEEKAAFLMQKCIRIKEVESEVDDLYESYMSTLFQVEKDAIAITKNKNIVQSLEDTTDKAKEVADCIKTMIVKL